MLLLRTYLGPVRSLFYTLGTLCLLLVFLGCGRVINREAERRIQNALPDLLGPAKQYRVHVYNAQERTLRGRLAHVVVEGEAVELSNGLLLDRLHLDLRGVEIDTNRRQVQQIKEATFTATIGKAALDEFLAGESPPEEPIRKVRVQLEAANVVTLSAERVTLGVGVPFRLTGPIHLSGPQRIEIDPTRLTVIGIPLTGLPLRFLKNRFETAVDLSLLPFPVTLTEAKTAPGQLLLTGSADVMAILKQVEARKP